jgi:hemerythrin-like domain-containing protein
MLRKKPETMEEVVGLYIKDVIEAYPAVGRCLEGAGIGCVTCSVGTCLIRDVVSIHNLTVAQEQDLFKAIAAIIFPGQPMTLPKIERQAVAAGVQKLSPPLQDMVNEHTNIKRVLAQIPALIGRIQKGFTAETRQTLAEVIDFIRQYADKFHHAKEEDLLFKYFDAESDILRVMVKEHEIGRHHVRSAAIALEQGDAAALIEHLTAYGALLKEHIRKEDEILYPWMNRELTDSQVGKLFARCHAVDQEFSARVDDYLGLVEKLEKN